jgi:hypothetical protein
LGRLARLEGREIRRLDMATGTKQPIVFGQLTARQAEDLHRFGTVTTILIPDAPPADFDLPGYPPTERQRLNEIADRWRAAYCGNFLREVGKESGDNWLIYEGYDETTDQPAFITTNHVHAGEYDLDAIDEFVCNAPEDVKWLLQMVVDLANPESEA